MRILIALTYYRPHYSGLTIYAERLARALVARGHRVTVLTSQYDTNLPKREVRAGVEIIRLPVLFRISKGVIMPSLPFWAWRLVRQADIVNLHVPQLDAAPIAVLARLLGKPVVLTYQCDLVLPQGFIHRVANVASNIANHISATAANVVVNSSQDYSENSLFLRKYIDKVSIVDIPVELPDNTEAEVEAIRKRYSIKPAEHTIGMVARLAAEKGVLHLVRALHKVLDIYPDARVLYVGPYKDVFGEEQYSKMLAPLIAEHGEHWHFLGVIPDKELAAIFQLCDLVVLPSTNSTEALGIVQVEAMTFGTPAVASDLPGLRQPVIQTGMGEIFPVADSDALAESIRMVLSNPQKYEGDVHAIRNRFSPARIAAAYEEIFQKLIKSN